MAIIGFESSTEKGIRNVIFGMILYVLFILLTTGTGLMLFKEYDSSTYGITFTMGESACMLMGFLLIIFVFYFYFVMQGGIALVMDSKTFRLKMHVYFAIAGFSALILSSIISVSAIGIGGAYPQKMGTEIGATFIYMLSLILLVFNITTKKAKVVMIAAIALAMAGMGYMASQEGVINAILENNRFTDQDMQAVQLILGIPMVFKVFSVGLFILAYSITGQNVYGLRDRIQREQERILSLQESHYFAPGKAKGRVVYCRYCGVVLKSGQMECPNCKMPRPPGDTDELEAPSAGQKEAPGTHLCPKCSHRMPPGSSFCNACGAKLSPDGATATGEPQIAQQQKT